MRAFVSCLGVCSAIIMCAVSGAMNYLFLSSLGKTLLEGQVLGAASAAADLFKALLPFFIAWSWNARRFLAAISGAVAFLFFAGFSLLSAIGFAADNRGVLVETRESLTMSYGRMQRDLRDAEAKRATLPAYRPASVVTESIEIHKQSRRWTATKECRNATETDSRLYCERYFALRADMAAAQEAVRLEEAITTLRAKAAKLREAGAGHDRDPQVSILSRIFGQEQDKVRIALIVIVALLVEIGSSLGLFLATGHRVSTETKVAAAHTTPCDPKSAGEVSPVASLEDFCLEVLVASGTGALGAEDLFAAYQRWCGTRGLVVLEVAEFTAAFLSLANSVGLRQEAGRYRGIELAPPFFDRRMAA